MLPAIGSCIVFALFRWRCLGGLCYRLATRRAVLLFDYNCSVVGTVWSAPASHRLIIRERCKRREWAGVLTRHATSFGVANQKALSPPASKRSVDLLDKRAYLGHAFSLSAFASSTALSKHLGLALVGPFCQPQFAKDVT